VAACIVPVKNGYLDGAVPTDYSVNPSDFLDDSQAFFGEHQRPFVVWTPTSQPALIDEVIARKGVIDRAGAPAMAIDHPVDVGHEFDVRVVTSGEDRATCAAVCEQGYEIPGLGWLMQHIESFDVPGATWVMLLDGDEPVGVACGFHDGIAGGVYYVATPPAHRGRGVARAATAWVTNDLFERGARSVVLQSSAAGLGVYKRLGFATYDTYDRYVLEPAQ
jgi:N-acetylglutamate synthase